jgi:hypothetical protein
LQGVSRTLLDLHQTSFFSLPDFPISTHPQSDREDTSEKQIRDAARRNTGGFSSVKGRYMSYYTSLDLLLPPAAEHPRASCIATSAQFVRCLAGRSSHPFIPSTA